MECATEVKSAELFREAMEPFQTAIKAGVELQEESIKRCTDILRDFGVPRHGKRKHPICSTGPFSAPNRRSTSPSD